MKNNSKIRGLPADGIIIHSMGQYIFYEGEYLYAYDLLDELGVSAHFLVDHTGNIVHGVDHDMIAYHAGLSRLGDQKYLNSTFIGIELLIEGNHTYETFREAIKKPESFTDKHYDHCALVCRNLMTIYPDITLDRIVRHSDVSGPDVRIDAKVDPGKGFDMERLKQLI